MPAIMAGVMDEIHVTAGQMTTGVTAGFLIFHSSNTSWFATLPLATMRVFIPPLNRDISSSRAATLAPIV